MPQRSEDIVNEIRPLLARMNGKLATVASVAARYSAQVAAVNTRLDRCVSLLRRGLRTEALHLAEKAPILLDEVAALDFPQREVFEQHCFDLGIVVPSLNEGAVTEINAAYPTEQRLENLLRWHRLLAIGRAPLKSRIRVLRKLSAADVQNSVWGEDLIQFEKHRHKQAEQEAALAWSRRDLGSLTALHNEFSVEPWLVPPPQQLSRSINNWHAVLLDEHKRTRLASLASHVETAYQSQDSARTALALDEWKGLAATITADTQSLQTQSVIDAMQWLERVQQQANADADYDRACATMELALDEHRPQDEIERLWAVFGRLERSAPRVLQTRFQSQTAEQSLQGKRRHRLVLAGLLCVTVLLASLVGWLVYSQDQQSRLDNWVAQVQLLIDGKRWQEAHKLLAHVEESDPYSWNSAVMQSASGEVNKGILADTQRRDRFTAALNRAKTAGTLAPDLDSMKVARELAGTDEERIAVEAFEGELQAASRIEQSKRDEAFTSALDVLRARFVEIRDGKTTNDALTQTSLSQLHSDLSQLLKTEGITPTVATSGQAMLTSVSSSMTSLNEKMARQKKQDMLLASARDSFKNPAAHAKALTQFIDAYPTHEMSYEFKKAMELAEGWESVALCFPVLDKFSLVRVNKIEEAREREKMIGELADKPVGAYRAILDDYREYLKTAVAALDPTLKTQQTDGELDVLLNNKLISGLSVVHLRSGVKYYVKSNYQLSPNSSIINLPCILTFEQLFDNKPPDILQIYQKDIDLANNPMPAPQSEFAKAAKQLSINPGQWETFHVRLAELLAAHEKIDPILRVAIMNQTMKWTMERDWPKHPELDLWLKELSKIRSDVEWLNFQNRVADTERAAAMSVFKDQPNWKKLSEKVDEWEKRSQRDLAPRISLGVVWREDGLRTVVPSPSVTVSGRMEVLAKSAEGTFRFEVIGTLTQGQASWLAAATSQPAGSIVYLSAR